MYVLRFPNVFLDRVARRCSIVPNSANVNLQSSQQSATRATSALAGPAAERISATQIQRTPDRGSSQFLNDTEVRNRGDGDADARVRHEDGVFMVDTVKEAYTDVPTADALILFGHFMNSE